MFWIAAHLLRFDQLRKDTVKEMCISPTKKHRHGKCEIQQFTEKKDETYLDVFEEIVVKLADVQCLQYYCQLCVAKQSLRSSVWDLATQFHCLVDS
jgi:hypothetical protein